jgi:hypothetical protein
MPYSILAKEVLSRNTYNLITKLNAEWKAKRVAKQQQRRRFFELFEEDQQKFLEEIKQRKYICIACSLYNTH